MKYRLVVYVEGVDPIAMRFETIEAAQRLRDDISARTTLPSPPMTPWVDEEGRELQFKLQSLRVMVVEQIPRDQPSKVHP